MSPSATTTSTARQGRQRSGWACEECRSRKLRCDGQQPCRVCADAGIVCEVNTQRQARGPKKGYLRALQNRVALLESQLAARGEVVDNSDGVEELSNVEHGLITPSVTVYPETTSGSYAGDLSHVYTRAALYSEPDAFAPLVFSNANSSPMPLLHTPLPTQISDVMHAELDQLYFERVHLSVPILHQRRYLSWSTQAKKKPSRVCVQHAVWTLAALLSAQFQYLQEPLFHTTKQLLDSLPQTGNNSEQVDTELAQAWILIATYESIRTQHRSAWMSAGRVFRLVQLMRLHEIDSPISGVAGETDFIETEQKRRVFWMAYFLDHLFSIRNDSAITLNEHMVCTRLPASETHFQNGQPVLGPFLSEALTEDVVRTSSYFNECIIIATVCGRSLFHGQQYHIRAVYGDIFRGLSEQHRMLDGILTRRLRLLSQHYPSMAETSDPMALFVNIMGHAAVIYLYKGVRSMPMSETVEDGGKLIADYQRQALAAAKEIVTAAKVLTEFYVFKMHALMPLPLFICAEFLYSNRNSPGPYSAQLQELLATFRQLKNVNDPNQSYIQLLELSCVAASSDIGKEAA